ncbi:hypothetical protein EZS27_036711, partial [termite gut metagenome]
KDSDGFMWFGTLYGLCSFDGVNVKVYNNHDGFFYSENPPRKIQTIAEDKNGFLWIKTADGKAYVFDRKKERFHLLCDEVEKHAESTKVIKIQKTPDGEIVILTGDRKLLLACTTDEKPTEVQLLHNLTPSSMNEKDVFLTHNVLDETNEFINWMGTDCRRYSYRKGKDLAKKQTNAILVEIGMDILESFTCAFNGENHLWVGDNAGKIYCIDPQTGIVDKYKLPGIDKAIQNLFVSSSNNETVYVYTGQGGMYEYNVKSDQLQRHSLNLNGTISYAFIDKYDKIWLSESENALLYYDPKNKIEKHFPISQGACVADMQIQDAGEQGLFILTPAGEMLIFERESLSMTRLTQTASFPAIPQTSLFFNQEFDEEEMLWLSSSSGIYCVNFLPKQFRLFGLQTFKRA